MRLKSFLESKDSLSHNDPEIQDALEKLKSELESVGLKQRPYKNEEGYKFSDGDENEAMAFFTDGILEFVILVDTKDRSEFRVHIQLTLLSKFSFDGNEVILANVGLRGLDLSNTLKIINDTTVQINKIEGFFHWILDVTGKYPGIKFKPIRAGLSSTTDGQKFNFPTSLAATGGEYSFYAKGENKREKVY